MSREIGLWRIDGTPGTWRPAVGSLYLAPADVAGERRVGEGERHAAVVDPVEMLTDAVDDTIGVDGHR